MDIDYTNLPLHSPKFPYCFQPHHHPRWICSSFIVVKNPQSPISSPMYTGVTNNCAMRNLAVVSFPKETDSSFSGH